MSPSFKFSPRLIAASLTCSLLISTAFSEVITQAGNSLSLESAVKLALEANPNIAVYQREVEAIEGVKSQAEIRPNPSLSTSIQDTRSDNRQVFVQLNQEIELGNKREARMEAADAMFKKASAELEAKKANIRADVISAFYGVLAAQEKLKLSQSSSDIAKQALDAAAKRVKAGKSAPVEETKSSIAATSAKIELNQAERQLKTARKNLSALWGSPQPAFESVEGNVENIPTVIQLSDLNSRLENAPTIKLAMHEVTARDGLTKIEQSKATPNITLSAGVVNNQELGGINQALLGLTVPIPIFDRNQGNIKESVSRQYKAQDELAALKTQLETNLAILYERLIEARLNADSIKTEILPNAQSAFDAATKGFNAGKFDFLDVLDAQRTLFQAKTQYIQALLEGHQSYAEIERILGDALQNSPNKPQGVNHD